jgi:Uma2 family endonuclease
MGKTLIKIGPADHGRRMSLEEFEHAKVQDGYLYELSRGVITVVDVPKGSHALQLIATRRQFSRHDVFHPGYIAGIMGSMECKLLIGDLASERHPDVASYLSPPPDPESKDFWSKWIPEIVIEIVSPSSRKRDYEEKPDEYLHLGAKEYWIIDPKKRAMVVMRRVRNRWVESIIQPPALYRTRLLPGLEFSCEAVFAAAGLT